MVWVYGFGIWWAAAVLVAVALHLVAKIHKEKAVMVAYVTRGKKYHKDENCYRMLSGENFWDGDSDDYYHNAGSFRREVSSLQDAAMRGKLPCNHCVPADERVYPPLYGQHFGHVPVVAKDPFDTEYLACARCTTGGMWGFGEEMWPVLIAWPCTTALVLGLVPRNPCEHCKGIGADPDDEGDWDPDAGMHNPNTREACPVCLGTGAKPRRAR